MDTQKDAPRWRILIVDNEEMTRQEHRRNLLVDDEDAYEIFVAGEKGEQGQSLLEDAIDKARRQRCHLALVLQPHLSYGK